MVVLSRVGGCGPPYLADLDAGVACFGHGKPVIGNAQERLQQAAATLNVE